MREIRKLLPANDTIRIESLKFTIAFYPQPTVGYREDDPPDRITLSRQGQEIWIKLSTVLLSDRSLLQLFSSGLNLR
jgi:hypothetical protein